MPQLGFVYDDGRRRARRVVLGHGTSIGPSLTVNSRDTARWQLACGIGIVGGFGIQFFKVRDELCLPYYNRRQPAYRPVV